MSAEPRAELKVQRHGAVLELVISNPPARNALHPDMYSTGREALQSIASDSSVGAVVLRGEGEFFCAGGNLQRLLGNRALEPQVQAKSIDALHAWVRAIRGAGVPVIAAVEGPAAGAGFSLVLACDLIVAASNAKFVMSYARVGLTPDGGAIRQLASRLPATLAFEILADAAPISAERLFALGVVNRLVDPGASALQAREWAERLARGPRQVLQRLKIGIEHMPGMPLDQALDAERDNFVRSLHEPDAGIGIEAFLAKRPPLFGSPT
jgi:enoyl-CoA hydratase/carnithine racemase